MCETRRTIAAIAGKRGQRRGRERERNILSETQRFIGGTHPAAQTRQMRRQCLDMPHQQIEVVLMRRGGDRIEQIEQRARAVDLGRRLGIRGRQLVARGRAQKICRVPHRGVSRRISPRALVRSTVCTNELIDT